MVQCKRFQNTVSSSIVRDLYGVLTHLRANKGILITTGTISSEARTFAEGKPLELIDGEKLLKLLRKYSVLEINSFQKDFDSHKNNEGKTFRTLISEINTEGKNNTLLAVVGIDEISHAFTINVEEDTPIIIEGYPHSGIDDCINTIICSLIVNSSPQLLKLILIDAKIVELSIYNGLPHLLTPVITDINKTDGILNWIANEMVNRYKILAENHVRNIEEYNKLPNANIMPKIVIVINELSDLIASSQYGCEKKIIELAKSGWTVGIHLIIATSFPDTSSLNIKKSVSLSNINFISKNYMSINLFSTSEKDLKIRSIFVSRNELEEIVSPLKSEPYLEYDHKDTETNKIINFLNELKKDELLKDALLAIN
ncbi:FtsK/SpoIIIE domain-containing protein [Thermoanaerobacterium thermosaccharolyticum]|uniref:restriction endonuclease n=1 Tax=Thermoanaerobacterium thermosaccharolyticum TaxID=1517 RepID=UPI003DA9A142